MPSELFIWQERIFWWHDIGVFYI